jgi:CubicO group peptidase (beta-lactamase class C family)
MTKSKISLALSSLTLFLLAVSVWGQTSNLSPSSSADVTRLQTELEPKITEVLKSGRLPGFAIGVVKNGKLIYAKGFGVRNLGPRPR